MHQAISNIFLKNCGESNASHLTKHAILSPNQYGFQENLSTDNAVYTLLNTILTALNNKSKGKKLFCDVEKAFDCVSHNILLCKLEIYGITRCIQEPIFSIS
jgi:hypothetical protein